MAQLSRRIRMAVLERDGYRCVYCGRSVTETVLEVDHVLPRARGGGDEPQNLVTACRDCNGGKRDAEVRLPDPAVLERPLPDWFLDRRRAPTRRPALRRLGAPWVIATSRYRESGRPTGPFRLSLYAEIDYTAMLGDVEPYPRDPFDWYCARLRDRYPAIWNEDAVPIGWTVVAEGQGLNTVECAPWHRHEPILRCGWDRWFTHPVDEAGDPIDWSRVPVNMGRFRGFEKSIGWLPTIADQTAPVRSLWVAKRAALARYSAR